MVSCCPDQKAQSRRPQTRAEAPHRAASRLPLPGHGRCKTWEKCHASRTSALLEGPRCQGAGCRDRFHNIPKLFGLRHELFRSEEGEQGGGQTVGRVAAACCKNPSVGSLVQMWCNKSCTFLLDEQLRYNGQKKLQTVSQHWQRHVMCDQSWQALRLTRPRFTVGLQRLNLCIGNDMT